MAERLRYAGFVEEASFMEDPAPAAAFHIDIASATLDTPSDTTMVYGGGRGRSPRQTRPGFYAPEGNIAYAIDIATIGWFFKWLLGEYVFTAGVDPNPNIHEMYGGNEVTLPTFTARLGKDVFEHVFRGCVANEFELEVEDEFAMLTMDIVGAKDESDAIQAVSALSLPEGFPMAFHDFTATIGGTDRSVDVKSFTLGVNNNHDAANGRSIGSRYPRRQVAGSRETSLSMTLFFDDIAEIERFWGQAGSPSDQSQTEFEMVLTGTAENGHNIVITLPRCVYSQVQTQPEGRDELVQSVEIVAYQGTATLEDATTVETDVYVKLTNDQVEMALA